MEPDSAVPATLSAKVTTGLLRHELNFDGVAITDSLDMGAVQSLVKGDDAEALYRALMAGNGARGHGSPNPLGGWAQVTRALRIPPLDSPDLLLHTGLHCRSTGKRSLPAIQDALVQRIDADPAAKARLREAARRVLTLKTELLGPSVVQRQSPPQQQQQSWRAGAEQLLALSRGPEVVSGIAKGSIAHVSDSARLLPLAQTFAAEPNAKCVAVAGQGVTPTHSLSHSPSLCVCRALLIAPPLVAAPLLGALRDRSGSSSLTWEAALVSHRPTCKQVEQAVSRARTATVVLLAMHNFNAHYSRLVHQTFDEQVHLAWALAEAGVSMVVASIENPFGACPRGDGDECVGLPVKGGI